MSQQRIVKLFRNGRSQAVRIPRDFALPGSEVLMRKEGQRIIIEPQRPTSLLDWLATLEPIDDELGPIEDLPAEDVHL